MNPPNIIITLGLINKIREYEYHKCSHLSGFSTIQIFHKIFVVAGFHRASPSTALDKTLLLYHTIIQITMIICEHFNFIELFSETLFDLISYIKTPLQLYSHLLLSG